MGQTILIITHGRRNYGIKFPDPGHTPKGLEDIRNLRQSLFNCTGEQYGEVVVGCARRFREIATELGLIPTRYTTVVGTADAITEDGKNIVTSYGELIPKEQFTTRADMGQAPLEFIRSLKHNSIICSGRPFVKQFGIKDVQEGSLYRFVNTWTGEGGFHVFKIMPDGTNIKLGTFCEFKGND